MKTMWMTKRKAVAAVLVVGVVGAGAGWLRHHRAAALEPLRRSIGVPLLTVLAPFGLFWPVSPGFRIVVVEALAVARGPVKA
jgi:hypothetical protein